jgi:hypothetical protein
VRDEPEDEDNEASAINYAVEEDYNKEDGFQDSEVEATFKTMTPTMIRMAITLVVNLVMEMKRRGEKNQTRVMMTWQTRLMMNWQVTLATMLVASQMAKMKATQVMRMKARVTTKGTVWLIKTMLVQSLVMEMQMSSLLAAMPVVKGG